MNALNLTQVQAALHARIVSDVPLTVSVLSTGKAPTYAAMFDSAQGYAADLVREFTDAHGIDLARTLTTNAAEAADIQLRTAGALVASYSAALVGALRYRPERED